MKTHQKEAKRSILTESVARKMNDLFEMGRTNEEIVLDYANKATELLKKAQEIIIEAANNISDTTQRKYFLEENIFNRKIMQAI